jgi:hypothetical protein
LKELPTLATPVTVSPVVATFTAVPAVALDALVVLEPTPITVVVTNFFVSGVIALIAVSEEPPALLMLNF